MLLLLRGGSADLHRHCRWGVCHAGSDACSIAARDAPAARRRSRRLHHRFDRFLHGALLAGLQHRRPHARAGARPRLGSLRTSCRCGSPALRRIPSSLRLLRPRRRRGWCSLDHDEQPLFPRLIAALHTLAAPFRVVPSSSNPTWPRASRSASTLATLSMVTEPSVSPGATLSSSWGTCSASASRSHCSLHCSCVFTVLIKLTFTGVFFRQTRWAGRRPLPHVQVPHHGRGRRSRLAELTCYNEMDGAAGAVQDQGRPARHAGRPLPAALEHRRAAAVLERAAGRHEHRRAAAAAPARGRRATRRGTGGRLTVQPGITGLWQVSGRSDLASAMVDLDTDYLEHWSLWLDVRILLRTRCSRFAARALTDRVRPRASNSIGTSAHDDRTRMATDTSNGGNGKPRYAPAARRPACRTC